MGSHPAPVQPPIRLGEDYELDLRPRRLRRGNHVLKLERIPLEILVLLIEHKDEVVSRDQIVARVWGPGVFLDSDNSIRGAIRKLRQALKDDADSPRFIQTITGQGYRFIAPVLSDRVSIDASVSAAVEKEPGSETAVAGSEQRTRTQDSAPDFDGLLRIRSLVSVKSVAQSWLALGGIALMMVLAIAYIAGTHHTANSSTAKTTSLAVLPLKNLSGDSSQEYLADGITEALIGSLSAIHNLRVISRTSVMHFKDTRLTLPEIARALHVDAVVEGSVIRDGNRIRVHAQLIRAATDEHFWSESYDRELGDVLALESDVAEAIARRVDVTVSGEQRSRVMTARHVSPEVYENYLRGQFALNNGTRADVEKSIRYFEQAINTDPNFAPSYVGLADAYDTLGLVFVGAPPGDTRAQVISAVRKAMELDPQLADAHILLADALRKQWKWTEAEAEYKRALELNPNSSGAHAGFADWLVCQGRGAEAIDWANQARELDPLVSGSNLAWILYQVRRYDEAARELRAALAVRPDDPVALWFLGFVLIAEEKPYDAIPVLEKAVSVSQGSPGARGVLVRAYAGAGRRKDAFRVLNGLKRQRQREYVPPAAFVQAYMGVGDYEQALVWLEQAYKEQSNLLQWINTESTFDPLRGDPRFVDLVHRVGLAR